MPRPQAPPVQIARWRAGDWRDDRDQVAAEEPLQLSLDGKPLSIVMRTPGNDLELAIGLLWAERVIRSLDDIARVRISAEAGEKEAGVPVAADLVESNQVDVHLRSSGGSRDRCSPSAVGPGTKWCRRRSRQGYRSSPRSARLRASRSRPPNASE